ncbi:DUF4179 domain-containing protein ['Paenibacillus yunnanensis' Narsing Rao et al. 2020]|uniref:DUF4179 domain-containing protein n=1 Tax=Paenibacillus tengchongensis TaxID=2608684 RepID=UPI00124C6AF0|nr:DUF4179 domain-containing protein [Paenibacillus tengchongensis]
MNIEQLERRMQAESEILKRESGETGEPGQLRLAVMQGLEQGHSRERQDFPRRGVTFALAAAAVIVLLLFMVPQLQQPSPQTAQVQEVDWGELEGFKRLSQFDMEHESLESAVRHNYIQLIGKSVQSGAYRVTLDAVTADENMIIMLYSATTDDSQEVYGISSARLKESGAGSYLETGNGISGNEVVAGEENYHKYYGKRVFYLDRSKPFPERLEADFQVASVNPGKMGQPKTGTIMADMHYSPRLKISFTLNAKFKQYATRIIYPDERFTLAGHEVSLAQVELSPLLVRIRMAFSNEADKAWPVRREIFQAGMYTEMVSTVLGGQVELKSSTGFSTEAGYERLYSSNMLDDPESLELKIRTQPGEEDGVLRFELLE